MTKQMLQMNTKKILLCMAMSLCVPCMAPAAPGTDAHPGMPSDSARAGAAADSAYRLDLGTMKVRALQRDIESGTAVHLSVEDFRRTSSDVPGILEHVAGVTVRRSGGIGEYASASIRGSNPSDVQVYLNGIPLNSAAGGAVDIGKIPLESVDRIHVYKGAAPLGYMANSSGAVISLETADREDMRSVHAAAGSFGLRKGGGLMVQHTDKATHRVSVDMTHTNGDYPYIHDKGQPLDPHSSDTVVRKNNNAYTTLGGQYGIHRSLGGNGAVDGQVSFVTRHKQHHHKALAFEEFVGVTSDDEKLNAGVEYAHYTDHDGRYAAGARLRYHTSLFEDQLGQYYLHHKKKIATRAPRVSAYVTSHTPIGKTVALDSRVEGSFESFATRRILSSTQWNRARRLQGTGAVELAVKPLEHVHGCVRYSHTYALDSSGIIEFFGAARTVDTYYHGTHYPNANAEVTFACTRGLRLYANARYDHRPVSFTERYGWGYGVIGNPDLEPEKQWQLSAGADFDAFDMLHAAVDIFGGRVQDYIDMIATSQHVMRAHNSGDVGTYGVETSLRLQYRDIGFIENICHYIDKRYLSAPANQSERLGNPPAYFSTFKNATRLCLTVGPASAGHVAEYRSPVITSLASPENTTALKPQLSAYVTWHVNRRLDISYRLDNYLYHAIEDAMVKYRPLPGRQHMVRVNARM
jgi:outer membrane cobalamin receptor